MKNTGHPFHSPIPDGDSYVDAGIFPSLQVLVAALDAVIREAEKNVAIPRELPEYLRAGLQELIHLRDAYRPVIEGDTGVVDQT